MDDMLYINEMEELRREKTYTIILEDGTAISDLKLNGNNFVSQDEITADIFDGNLGRVNIISDDDVEDVHTNMKLIQITKMGDEWYFILADIPESELREAKTRSDIDYLAMMIDVEV